MAKLSCKVCGSSFDAGDKETVQKVHDSHVEKFHGNKEEQVKTALTAAKSMAFQVVHGSMPKRKDARALVTMTAMLLDEAVPDMPEEKSPTQDPAKTTGESKTGAAVGETSAETK